MSELQGCAICGAAMVDVELHSKFHQGLDESAHTLDHVESDVAEALEKAQYATNVLYNRGLD